MLGTVDQELPDDRGTVQENWGSVSSGSCRCRLLGGDVQSRMWDPGGSFKFWDGSTEERDRPAAVQGLEEKVSRRRAMERISAFPDHGAWLS